MRRFEIIQLVVVAVAVFLPVLLGFRLKRGRMAVLLVAAMVAQLVVEGFRWQLWPLHLATVGLALGDVLWDDRRVRGFQRFRRGVLGVVGLALLAALPVALPVPRLPAPSGPFAVGTRTFEVTDDDRQDPYAVPAQSPAGEEEEEGDAATEPRQMVVQAWYPAVVAEEADPVPWTTDFDLIGPAVSRRLGLPWFFLAHTAEVASHSYAGARPLSGRFPIVLYSHGWGAFRGAALDQMEELASHGYLVLAVDHPRAAIATRFDDGHVVRLDPEALPDPEDVDAHEYERATELLVETMGGDLLAVLDALMQGEEGPFGALAAHADGDLVGIYGHSVGGGAAVWACLQDEQCDGVAGLDPWVEPIPDPVIAEELQVPSMFIRSDEWRSMPNDRRLRGLAERSPDLSYWIGIEGASHNDFVLIPWLSPLADRANLKGPIPAERIHAILDIQLVAFFDRHLLGVGGAALTDDPPPEVNLEVVP